MHPATLTYRPASRSRRLPSISGIVPAVLPTGQRPPEKDRVRPPQQTSRSLTLFARTLRITCNDEDHRSRPGSQSRCRPVLAAPERCASSIARYNNLLRSRDRPVLKRKLYLTSSTSVCGRSRQYSRPFRRTRSSGFTPHSKSTPEMLRMQREDATISVAPLGGA